MPTSSDELRQKFGFGQKSDGTFEDGINAAEQVIKKYGGTLHSPSLGMIKVPESMEDGVSFEWSEYDKEEFWDAVQFLCEEWDYAVL